MKKFFLLTTLLFIASTLFAQHGIEYQKGPFFELEENEEIVTCFKGVKNGFYAISKHTKEKDVRWIKRFNSEMELISSNILEIPKGSFKWVKFIDNKLYLFTQFKDIKAGKSILYLYELDEHGEINSESRTINEIPILPRGSSPRVGLTFSQDSSKVLIVSYVRYLKITDKKKYKTQLNYNVYDSKFNLLLHKQNNLPYLDRYLHLKSHRIDNEGNIFSNGILEHNKHRKNQIAENEQKMKFLIFHYDVTTSKFVEHRVNIESKWIHSFTFWVNEKKSEVYVTGLYATNDDFRAVHGVFNIVLDKNSMKVKTKATNLFSEKIQGKLRPIAWYGKIRSSNITLTDSNGYYIVMEHYETSKDNYTKETFYHYNDIVVIKMSETGELDWCDYINKKTTASSVERRYLSYAVQLKESTSDLVVLYKKSHIILNISTYSVLGIKSEKDFQKFTGTHHFNKKNVNNLTMEEKKSLELFLIPLVPKIKFPLSKNETIYLNGSNHFITINTK